MNNPFDDNPEDQTLLSRPPAAMGAEPASPRAIPESRPTMQVLAVPPPPSTDNAATTVSEIPAEVLALIADREGKKTAAPAESPAPKLEQDAQTLMATVPPEVAALMARAAAAPTPVGKASVPSSPREQRVELLPTLASTEPPAPAPARRADPSPQAWTPPVSFDEGSDFPAGWDRYQNLGLLGQGGMGKVYKAFDPRLQRTVALKFMSDPASYGAQLMREASSQAHIEHRHVCKVYEVGEVAGRPFVAMQYISGLTLDEAALEMNLSQKLVLMETVCDAIQAAHRLGMLHRDLKPPNIMVERGDDGSFQPYVMDFGLARDPRSAGATAVDAIMGTPNFMSPEQARGDQKALDRRSDVYSLGATLYYILTGRPPYEGTSALQVVAKVLSEAPPSMRSILPSVPADVEAIVAKSMAREPQDRYDSARAFGDDIHRYLEGDPVEAGPASFGYRLGRRLRKHRILVGIAGGAVVLVGFFGGAAIRARMQAQTVARLTQTFGDRVHEIDSRMRLAYSMPPHDVRVQRREVSGRIDEIKAQMKAIGPAAEGPGNYALGRGYQILGQLDAAQQGLERAWSVGNREPAVAYALGQLWLRIYEFEHEEALRTSGGAKEVDAAETARTTALHYLEMARALPSVPSDLLEAQILAMQAHRSEALERARAAFSVDPLLFEAKVLEGILLSAQGHFSHRKGDLSEARDLYARSEASLRVALNLARSYPPAHLELCRVLYREAMVPGATIETQFKDAADACRLGMTVDPDDDAMASRLGTILMSWSEWRLSRGLEPLHLDDARDSIEKALLLNPKSMLAYRNLADVHRVRAQYLSSRGQSATSTISDAIAAIDRGKKFATTPKRLFILLAGEANIHVAAARDALFHGRDPGPDLLLAYAALERCRETDPKEYRVITLAAEAGAIAVENDLAAGRVAGLHLATAMSDAQLAADRSKKEDPAALAVLSHLEATRALVPPGSRADAERAISHARDAIQIDEHRARSWRVLAEGYLALAKTGVQSAWADAHTAIDKAIAINARDAELFVLRAQVALGDGAPRSRERANEAIKLALAIDPERRLGPTLCSTIGTPDCR